MAKSRLQTILGTMQFGMPTDCTTIAPRVTNLNEIKEFLDIFNNRGFTELDTARMYCGGNTEKCLGQLNVKKSFHLATKAPPPFTLENLRKNLNESLKDLQVSSADLFYLHWPDHQTPIDETLQAVDILHKEGLFKEFGLSNYTAWQVAYIHGLCKSKGMIVPTVYQGMYNAVTRSVEPELLPCLRELKIRFYAYNPLAGGLLSGRYKFEDDPKDGRFSGGVTWGLRYRERYWHQSYFESIQEIQKVISSEKSSNDNQITLADTAFSWLINHSKLDPKYGDGIIIGASSIQQLEANLNSCIIAKPLSEKVVLAFDEAWSHSKSNCPTYFR